MKLTTKPGCIWSGIHSPLDVPMISIVRGYRENTHDILTNIYIGTWGDGFDVWIEDCPKIETPEQLWKIFMELGVFDKALEGLTAHYYQLGEASGRQGLQYQLKELLNIY